MNKKLSVFVFLVGFLIVLVCPIQIKAREINILAINGGDERDESEYLYSEPLFVDCLKDLFVNGQAVPKENIHEFVNPTYSQIEALLDNTYKDNTSDTLSIFYYSGHGTSMGGLENDQYGLYTHDGDCYTFTRLYQKLHNFKGEFVVILDCCYSGAFLTQNTFDDLAQNKFLVLTACEEKSFSPTFDKMFMNIMAFVNNKKLLVTRYTDTILKGLGYYNGKLAADKNKDNIVTSDELFSYLNGKRYKKAYTYTHNSVPGIIHVKPQKWGNVTFNLSNIAISLNKTEVSIKKGNTVKLSAFVKGSTITPSWKSSDTTIVSVDSNGRVSAKKKGVATITCSIGKITAKCVVTVKNPDTVNQTVTASNAYKKLIQQYEKKYGKAHLYNYSQYKHFWTGLCFAKLLDFNGDGTKELILAYQTEKTKIDNVKYHVELWTFDGKKAKRIVSGISWSGNNIPYFGGFQIIKQNGKYLLRLTDNAGWIDKYYGTKRDGTLGLVHSFLWKGDAMKGQWYYNGKAISVAEYQSYYYKFNQNSTGYGFSNSKGDDEIRNEISKTKKTLKM